MLAAISASASITTVAEVAERIMALGNNIDTVGYSQPICGEG